LNPKISFQNTLDIKRRTSSIPTLNLPHVDDATDAVAGLHVVEGLGDLAKRLSVCDELVDLELALQVVVDEVGQLSATLDTAEGAALPYTTGDELECYS